MPQFDHLRDPSLEELHRILDDAIAFAEKHAASEQEMAELRADPSAVSLVNRFHGERYDLAQRVLPQAGRGRDVCSTCAHPVYFDDRPGLAGPARYVCLVCLTSGLGPLTVEQTAALACPRWCPWLRGRTL